MDFVNQTDFPAGWTLGFEPDGRELLVVVLKITHTIPEPGEEPQAAAEQVPLVEADEFTGEAGLSATLYETDYAHRKPMCDVLLNGSAHAPNGDAAVRVRVGLKVGSMEKSFVVVGDRRWDRFMMQCSPTLPLPFRQKAISYDKAYGGCDSNPSSPGIKATYPLNPVGVGYYPFSNGKHLVGKPLPSTEENRNKVASKDGRYRPMAFGPMSRNFKQRVIFAGTYDDKWLSNQVPFWPDDFDYRYFQAAPADQQIPFPKGGEPVILSNLHPKESLLHFFLPQTTRPVVFVPADGRAFQIDAETDTLLFEPDRGRFTQTLRISLPLRKSCFDFRQVVVGETLKTWHRKQRSAHKPYFKGIEDYIKWRKMKHMVN